LTEELPSDPPLAEVRTMDELHAALRARALALRLVFDGRCRNGKGKSLDAVAGLPDGYAGKLLAPVPVKHVGRTSLGPLLAALGCKLLLVEDPESYARITSGVERHPPEGGYARSGMLAPEERIRRRNIRNSPFTKPGGAKVLNARRFLLLGEGRRKEIARAAAKARWRRNFRAG
jgi:hypothetical protein